MSEPYLFPKELSNDLARKMVVEVVPAEEDERVIVYERKRKEKEGMSEPAKR